MQEPLIEHRGLAGNGRRSYERYSLTGPLLEHRGYAEPVRLLIPCDLSNLDACLQRLPQDKPRMGFRLNINHAPWMLRPNGNWGTAKVSRKDGRRMGWERGRLFVHADGICIAGYSSLQARSGELPLPPVARVAKVIAEFSLELSANPADIQDYGVDTTTHSMCGGKALTVEQSKARGVGPECIQVLEKFLGLGTDKTIEEMESPLHLEVA